MTKRKPGVQRGSASIEFSLVFILYFLVFYGMVGYTLPLLLSASYQEIASESLREAVTLHFASENEGDIDIPARVQTLVQRSWVPNRWLETCDGYNNGYLKQQETIWRVCLRYSSPESIIPTFSIFDWQVPALPHEIRGEAEIMLKQSP